MEGEEHIEIYGRLREEIGMKTYFHGPIDYAKTLKLHYRAGDPELPERTKRFTSNRDEEE